MASLIAEMIKLTVPEYIPMGLITVLLGYTFSLTGPIVYLQLILIIVCTAFVICGYNSFNAIFDVSIDRINKPHRPLARGTIKVKHALYSTLGFFLISIIIATQINIIFLYVIIAAIFLSILYSIPPIYLKGRAGLGTVTATGLYAIFFPLAGWAAHPANPLPLNLIFYLFVFGFGIGILKDFEDRIGDSIHKVHTILGELGYSRTLILSASLAISANVILLILVLTNMVSARYLLATAFTVPILINLYVLYKKRDIEEGKNAFIRGYVLLIFLEIMLVVLSLMH